MDHPRPATRASGHVHLRLDRPLRRPRPHQEPTRSGWLHALFLADRVREPWWSRPLKYGEVACTLSHLACGRHAARAGDEPFIVILEDDAILPATFLDELLAGLRQLAQHSPFDLLYLGRFPLEPGHDQPALDGFVTPAYSHCTFGYLLTRPAIDLLLATHLGRAIIPVDEFLPLFLYIDHPRPDLRTRFPRQLTALAFDPPLVRQRPKDDAGSDTEDSDFVEPTACAPWTATASGG